MAFVELMWPPFIKGRHHQIMAEAFQRIGDGDLKRLLINQPPRTTKSIFTSFLLPAWYLGRFPNKKVIQASHTAELAVGFGRQVRNLVAEPKFREVFPELRLTADSKAAGRWTTSEGGEYFAIGVGGNIAGRGADLFIIDDPHSEQDLMAGNPDVFDRVYDWYTSGPRQRLQPGGTLAVCMTRWHKRDLTGQIIKHMTKRTGVDQWELIEFPAILPSGAALWPEFWPLKEVEAIRDELPAAQWLAQYQQNPTSEEGAIVKREWWRIWPHETPPDCEFVIQSWDTAYLKTQRADFSACTTWGVFYHPDDNGIEQANIILLDAFKERMEFPKLKRLALEMYNDRKPDAFIIEGKASGWPLIFELRAMGIPVTDYTPVRGTKANPNDKLARVNAISVLFESGVVWRPETRWAEEVSEEFAEFPDGDNDDLVDSGTIALTRFRQGGFLTLNSDEEEEPIYRKRIEYY